MTLFYDAFDALAMLMHFFLYFILHGLVWLSNYVDDEQVDNFLRSSLDTNIVSGTQWHHVAKPTTIEQVMIICKACLRIIKDNYSTKIIYK